MGELAIGRNCGIIPDQSLYVWMWVPPNDDLNELNCPPFLCKDGIDTVPGVAFGASGEGYVRLALRDLKEPLEATLS